MEATTGQAPGEQELYSSWALFILVSLLAGALWTSYFLQLRKITAVHETVVSIVAGMLVGFVIRVSPGNAIQEMVTFNHSYFFNLLLPPIILNSGYELRKLHFFRNFGSILFFAFVGTVVSTIVIGILVWIIALTGVEGVSLSLIDSLIFGSVLSSTDPVTILAIFSQLKVDPKLYAVIFGESMLNDAVAIVLFGTFESFRGEELHVYNVFLGVRYFLGVFFGSLVIGLVTGTLVALTLKHSRLREFPAIESCLVALTAYSTYLFSNGCQMSGIVSLLFCGISLKHYAYENMSRRTRRTTRYMFAVLAQLSENFIFIYLGITLFTKHDEVFKPFMIIMTSIIIVIARFCSVFPLAHVINFFTVRVLRRHQEVINRSHQIMLFWAGLRGAVAFALAYNIQGVNGAWLQTTILCVVVISVIGFGGTTSRMVKKLGIRTGVVEPDNQGSSEDEDDEWADGPMPPLPLVGSSRFSSPFAGSSPGRTRRMSWGARRDGRQLGGNNDDDNNNNNNNNNNNHDDDDDGADPGSRAEGGGDDGLLPAWLGRERRHRDDGHWFLAFDNRYIKPLLSVRPAIVEDRRRRRRLGRPQLSTGATSPPPSVTHSSFNIEMPSPASADGRGRSSSLGRHGGHGNTLLESRQPAVSGASGAESLSSSVPSPPEVSLIDV